MYRNIFFTFLFVITAGIASAQQNLTLYNMQSIPQSMYYNPASMPFSRVNVSLLPLVSSYYVGLTNTGFKYTDLIRRRSDDSLYIDMPNAIGKMAEKNYLSNSFLAEIFMVGFKLKKNYFSLSITEKMMTQFRYPKDFFNFIYLGNGGMLGEKIDFDFGFRAIHYREYALGFAREIDDKLTVGGRLKYLYGMENISTEKTDFSIYTDPNSFAITATSDILINTSGLDSTSMEDFENIGSYLFKRKNRGLGIDAGARYQYNEKFSFSAAVNDLGFISWKSGVTNFQSKNPGASFTFSGIDFNEFTSQSENTDSLMSNMLDSMYNTFDIEEKHNKYRTGLYTQFNIGGNYHLSERNFAGLLLHGQFFDGKLIPAATVSFNSSFKNIVNASISYSVANRSYNNIGMGLALNLFALQVYVVSDNVLGMLLPQNTKNVNIRFGLNLVNGRKPLDKDKDGVPDNKDACPDEPGKKENNGCPEKTEGQSSEPEK